ncbi:MFS transporter [Actinomadura sp. CNU-125]|uniref:MFS transporter n=1 Tax=Actinomadura sp. CNU-125 TaxID=1904961 RepID=UPI00095F0AEC|nr:MFS transporter [Actinomadura sp. CNU-125]OLT10062.1 MFS transporter [Actinomadura sp. CNU-125]
MTRENDVRLGGRVWTMLAVLGLVGQVAWTVENMYLNVFVYETVSGDPDVIAGMVAASAAAATLATLTIGALSDRLGRRRAFIVAGYLAWGLSTAAFGLVSVDAVAAVAPFADAVVATVVVVILLDCVMSFLGSGANDAAFQAWVTDVTRAENRGRVESVLAIMPLMSMLLVFGGLDWMTRDGRWSLFFVVIGLLTAAAGAAAWAFVRDRPARRQDGAYLAALVHGLRPRAVRENPRLYLALSAWCVWGVSTQIFLPYLIIYLEKYLRIEGYALVLGVVLTGASAVSVACGRLIDRVGKARFLIPAVLVYAAGLLLMPLATGMAAVTGTGLVMMSGFMLVLAPLGALVRDCTPPGRAGHVQGLRMVFAILIPMIVGPFLGAAVIKGADERYVELGVTKHVPTPGIFLAAAAVLVLIVPPVLALRRGARTMEAVR